MIRMQEIENAVSRLSPEGIASFRRAKVEALKKRLKIGAGHRRTLRRIFGLISLVMIVWGLGSPVTSRLITCAFPTRSAKNVYRKSAESKSLFTPNDPFPTSIGKAGIGTPYSTLRLLYPDGKLDSRFYRVRFEEGPFEKADFDLGSEGDDPQVESVYFYFRDSDARRYVKEEALAVFGCWRAKVQWGIFDWPDLNGHFVELNIGWYAIMTSSPGIAHRSENRWTSAASSRRRL